MATGEVSILHKGGEYDLKAEWKISDLDYPLFRSGFYWSPGFDFQGEEWCFNMWPDSHWDPVHIDVGLYNYASKSSPILVQFSFALKNVNGEMDMEKQTTVVVKERRWHCIDRFLSRSEYRRRKSEFLVNGFLTLVCTIKILSAVEVFEDLTRKYEDAQLMLEKTARENDDIKKELDAYKIQNEILLKGKLDLEDDLKATKENLVAECSDCKRNVDVENISTHEKKCLDRPVMCPNCSEVVLLKEWHDHENQAREAEGETNASVSSVVSPKSKFSQ